MYLVSYELCYVVTLEVKVRITLLIQAKCSSLSTDFRESLMTIVRVDSCSPFFIFRQTVHASSKQRNALRTSNE